MASLAFARSGDGRPLVLLHGLGSSRQAWEPVIPALEEHFDVLAIDLPGFGESTPLPENVDPLPAALAASVAELLDELGIKNPHLAGNSLGGWVALELAHIRPTSSLTLLSPAGFWKDRAPAYCRASLRASRWFAERAGHFLARMVNYRIGRVLLLGQTQGQPGRITPDFARATIRAMATCPGFKPTFEASVSSRYRTRGRIEAPVTVAFGSRDRLLLKGQCRHFNQLPPGIHLAELPRCGHVPMADDPRAVAGVIEAAALRG